MIASMLVLGLAQTLPPDPTLEAPALEVTPRAFSDHRADAILLDSVVREDGWWLHPNLAVAIYDPRRDVVVARWSPGVSVGRRFTRWGLFAQAELDQTLDFSLDTERLDVLNLGAGVEHLSFMGHVRSSLAVGAAVLLTETVIDEAGEAGWFIDLRPGALRWGVGDRWAVEFTPIALDIIVPVPTGIPLVVYSYTTVVGVEWSPR